MPGLTISRSTTASIVRPVPVASSAGASAASTVCRSMRTRTNPSATTRSRVAAASSSSAPIGASTISFDRSGRPSSRVAISSTVCAVSGCPQATQCAVPARANSSSRSPDASASVATVLRRATRPIDWATATTGGSPSTRSTSGRAIAPAAARAAVGSVLRNRRRPSANTVPISSDDFPPPLAPVTTTSRSRGRSTSTPTRLFSRAPRTAMASAAFASAAVSVVASSGWVIAGRVAATARFADQSAGCDYAGQNNSRCDSDPVGSVRFCVASAWSPIVSNRWSRSICPCSPGRAGRHDWFGAVR